MSLDFGDLRNKKKKERGRERLYSPAEHVDAETQLCAQLWRNLKVTETGRLHKMRQMIIEARLVQVNL